MSILPYMVVSLMLGIGSLSYEKAGKLAITGGIVLVASWFLAFAIVFLTPFAFPSIKGGSFFSTSLVEVAKVDFIDLYIPVNPFSSMARTVVPAAAVFSVAFGVALIGVENKQSLLDILSATSKTLTRIAMMVVKLTPIGVCAIAANAAGTMTIEELGRLQSYIIPFIVATLLLTFWILPGLAAALTPFSYREILKSARDALTTGFAGVVGEKRAKNVKRYLPNTEIVLLETYSDFFTDNPKTVDALVISAEAGSAWTILYPAYSVVVPEPHLKANAAFAMPLAALDFEDFINDWLQMEQTSGIIDKLYNKWILGMTVEQKKGRWSIGRDLFGLWE